MHVAFADPNIVVPFKIYECTKYYDKNRPSWRQMEKLAIHVSQGNPKPVGCRRLARVLARLLWRVVEDADSRGDEDDE